MDPVSLVNVPVPHVEQNLDTVGRFNLKYIEKGVYGDFSSSITFVLCTSLSDCRVDEIR